MWGPDIPPARALTLRRVTGRRGGMGAGCFLGVELLSVERRMGSPTEAGAQVEALDEASWGVNTSPREKLPDIYILDKLV